MSGDGEAFVTSTNARLGLIEASIASHLMPDDGRTDRHIQSAIINLEREMMNRLNDVILNNLIDAKIISSASMIQAINDTANQQRQTPQSSTTTDGNPNGNNRWHKSQYWKVNR